MWAASAYGPAGETKLSPHADLARMLVQRLYLFADLRVPNDARDRIQLPLTGADGWVRQIIGNSEVIEKKAVSIDHEARFTLGWPVPFDSVQAVMAVAAVRFAHDAYGDAEGDVLR